MCDNIGDSQTVVCRKSLWLYKGVFRLRFTRWCAMSQSVVGFCAIVWLVEWVAPTPSVRYRQFSLVNQIMPFFFLLFFFIVCRPHCCPPLCFYFDHFVSHLCIILWPCIASLEKTILVVSSTFCRNRRCKCLYIVQHLYKYLLSALSWGWKKIEVY